MKKAFFITALLAMQVAASAQTTVVFKPDPSQGDNTSIMTTYGCTPAGYPSPVEFINAGTTAELPYMDWTFNAMGCGHGTIRSLIRFNQVSTIPAGATILNAQLRLFGVPTSTNFGNSTYPGSPYPLSNDGEVYQVTSPWSISSVTWNTQPSFGGTPVAIPPSTSRWSYNASVSVTGMVANMVSTGNNFGFLTKLQTEAYYRAVLFAGNGHADQTLWPELEITYCDATFTYCFDANHPYLIQLSANTIVPGNTYEWSVNGAVVGSGPTFSYPFPGPGTFRVCLQTYGRNRQRLCNYCLNICVADNGRPIQPSTDNPNGRGSNPNVIKGHLPTGDMPASRNGMISPNPTQTGWNIRIDNSANAGSKAEVTVYDMNGKVLSKQTRQLGEGTNTIYQDAAKLAPGTYLIEYTNGKTNWKEKVVKE